MAATAPVPELLHTVDLFRSLSDKELRHVCDFAKEMAFPAGRAVAEEGTPGGRFFFILDGTASVTAGGRTVATLHAGDYFGEMSLLDEQPRSATVTATTPLRTLTLASFNFADVLEHHPSICRK